jgi:hypothetical protein
MKQSILEKLSKSNVIINDKDTFLSGISNKAVHKCGILETNVGKL